MLLLCAAIQFLCTQHDRPAYRVPLFPYLPAASLLLNCFLMASLPARAYWQLGIFWGLMLVFYLLYSVHAANRFEDELSTMPSTTQDMAAVGKAVDIVNMEGGARGDAAAAAEHAGSFNAGTDGSHVRSGGSLIDRINSGAQGADAFARALGRRSAGITRLPPPTL